MNALTELTQKLERLAASPPKPTRTRVSVPVPRPLMTGRTAGGQRRAVLHQGGQVRSAAVQQARAKLVADARREIVAATREALRR